MYNIRLLALLGLLFIGLTGQTQISASTLPPSTDTVFYMEKYIKLVDDLLDSMEATGTLAGYQCVINKDGVKNYSRAGGFSIHETDNDGVRVDMTTDRRHNVASLSKYITTILLAMVLEEHSIPFDTAIVSYLPSTWTDVDEPSIHPNHITPGNPCEITFEKLVTHRTCIDFEGGTENNACSNGVIPDCNAGLYYLTDDLLARLALPEDLTCCGQNDYQNANFELARVLITHIVYPDLDEEAGNYNDISVLLYHSLLNQMVYQPLGIDAPWGEFALREYHQTEPIRAYQYPFIPTSTTLTEDSSACHGILGAWLTSNWDRNAGGSGLVLSTEDYAKILRTFIHTEILVSDSVKNYVIDNFLGLSLNEQTFGITPFGTFRNKNGRRGATCNGRAYSTSLFIYPNGLETVVFFNSNTRTINGQGIPIGPQGIIRDAWASAWKRDCNAFKHVTREGSLAGNWTAIDDPLTNGDPSKLLFITEELTSSNNSSSPQGVWYTNFGNWAIFNQDGATMNIGQRFNVLVIDEDNPNAFKHTAQLNNLTGAGLSRTIITHPELNNNPDAHIMITQNWQSTPGVYNVHPVGVFYDSSSGYWQIYNTDGGSMSEGATFNVYVDAQNKPIHVAESPIATYTVLDESDFDLNPGVFTDKDLMFLTQRKSTIIDNSSELGLVFNGGNWLILNKNSTDMVDDSEFNLLRFEDCECCADNKAPIWDLESLENDTTDGCLEDFNWNVRAYDQCGGPVQIESTSSAIFTNGYQRVRFTISASDQFGNESSESKWIYFEDSIAPVIQGVPNDFVVQCAIPALPDATAVDNCTDELEWEFEEMVEGNSCDFKITRTWTVEDLVGNESTASYCIYSGTYADEDNDGFDKDNDCDDNDPLVYPEADEICNLIDDDCNGLIDDNCTECVTVDSSPVDLTKSFDPVNGVQDRVQVKWYKASPQIKFTDEDAVACDIKFWEKRDLDPLTGLPVGPVIQNPDTIIIVDAKKFNPDFSPRSIFKWPIKFRADGANNNKRAQPNKRYEWQVRCACYHGDGPESLWSEIKIFNTPAFDPVTGVYTPPPDILSTGYIELKGLSDTEHLRFKIFPNPAFDGVFLDLSEIVDEDLSYSVNDITGKEIKSGSIKVPKDGKFRLSLKELRNGLYLIRVETPSGYSTQKLEKR